jgi:hypothetical protein
MVMVYVNACVAWLLLISTASAETAGAASADNAFYVHLAVTGLGLIFAVQMANQAFARKAFQLADTPTFPRYMTNAGQYYLGNGIFILFSSFIFLLLVLLHKDVIQIAEVASVPLPKALFEAVKQKEVSYLVIIAAMGAVYLYVLRTEANWNVLLWMRDLIQSWISVPQLGHKIVNEIQYALKVPGAHLDDVVNSSVSVSKGDFGKDSRTIDRTWAELSYLRWWILERRNRGGDGTFFGEPSFTPDELLKQYHDISFSVSALKDGQTLQPPMTAETVYEQVRTIHKKFCRLVACYLLYQNGSKQRLTVAARKLGIPFTGEQVDNPLRYSIIFVLALIAAVNLGVYGLRFCSICMTATACCSRSRTRISIASCAGRDIPCRITALRLFSCSHCDSWSGAIWTTRGNRACSLTAGYLCLPAQPVLSGSPWRSN